MGRCLVFGTARNVPQCLRLSAPPDSGAENLPKIARFRPLARRPLRFESAPAANFRPKRATGRDRGCGSSGSLWPRKVARASPLSTGLTLPDSPRECPRTSAGTIAAIARAFPPWRRTPKPLWDQKYRAAAQLRTCPNDARLKIALRLLLQAGFPSISPVDAWVAAPCRDSPLQEFL